MFDGTATQELNQLVHQMTTRDEQQALKMNVMYRTLMEDQAPEQKYSQHRRQLAKNLKSKSYWPEGMKHPQEYRGFYWTDDMAFCGFATLNH